MTRSDRTRRPIQVVFTGFALSLRITGSRSAPSVLATDSAYSEELPKIDLMMLRACSVVVLPGTIPIQHGMAQLSKRSIARRSAPGCCRPANTVVPALSVHRPITARLSTVNLFMLAVYHHLLSKGADSA